MNTSQRFGRYFMGLFIGVLISYAIFSNRGCSSWLPTNVVKSEINEHNFSYSSSAACIMECLEISEADLQTLVDNGKVNFSESGTHDVPRNYVIESEDIEGLKVKIELQDSTSYVKTFFSPKSDQCGC